MVVHRNADRNAGRCCNPQAADPCGGAQYYCTSDGLRNMVPPGYYSDTVDQDGDPVAADLRYAIQPCAAGHSCIGYACEERDGATGECAAFAQGSGEQIPCAVGSFSAPLEMNCTLAAPGSFSAVATEELYCPIGHFTAEPGQSECQPCDPGRHAAEAGSSACKVCFVVLRDVIATQRARFGLRVDGNAHAFGGAELPHTLFGKALLWDVVAGLRTRQV